MGSEILIVITERWCMGGTWKLILHRWNWSVYDSHLGLFYGLIDLMNLMIYLWKGNFVTSCFSHSVKHVALRLKVDECWTSRWLQIWMWFSCLIFSVQRSDRSCGLVSICSQNATLTICWANLSKADLSAKKDILLFLTWMRNYKQQNML